MSTLAGWCDSKIIPRLLDTNDVSSLSSIPTWDITLEKEQKSQNQEYSSYYLCDMNAILLQNKLKN